MRKLEDIPKQSVFRTPEGYFDQLPTKIQSRMSEKGSSSNAVVSFLRYALPVAALLVFGIVWFRPEPRIEDQLQDIDSDQIAFYLQDNEHADLEEVHDPNDWTTTELKQLEDQVHSNMDYTDQELLEELDLENL